MDRSIKRLGQGHTLGSLLGGALIAFPGTTISSNGQDWGRQHEPCSSDPFLGPGILDGILRTDLVQKFEQLIQLNHLSGLFFSHRLELLDILLL